jgi:hypothetical protein
MSETPMKKFRFSKTGPSSDWIDATGTIFRKCTGCESVKHLSEDYFWPQRATKSGFRSKCKLCLGYQSKKKWGTRNPPTKECLTQRHKSWRHQQPAGIYKITCISNNRVYIGESLCLPVRFHSHKSDLNSNDRRTNKDLQIDWNMYGEQSFIFEIIETTEKNKKLLKNKERYYINKFLKEGKQIYNSLL